jgi:hypothetical protein
MGERENRYEILAKEFCSCKHCGAKYPEINVRSVEYKEKRTSRKKTSSYLIRARCTSKAHTSRDTRDFEIEVPYNQFWFTLTR